MIWAIRTLILPGFSCKRKGQWDEIQRAMCLNICTDQNPLKGLQITDCWAPLTESYIWEVQGRAQECAFLTSSQGMLRLQIRVYSLRGHQAHFCSRRKHEDPPMEQHWDHHWCVLTSTCNPPSSSSLSPPIHLLSFSSYCLQVDVDFKHPVIHQLILSWLHIPSN